MLEIVPDIAQSTHGIRNIFADIRNVPTRPHMVLGMFLLPFSVRSLMASSRISYVSGRGGVTSVSGNHATVSVMRSAEVAVARTW